MSELTNESAHELITRYLAGEASATDQQELQAWIGLRAENKALFDEMKKAWERADDYYIQAKLRTLNTDTEWNKFKDAIDGRRGNVRLSQRFSFAMLRVAATILFLLVTIGWVAMYFSKRNEGATYTTVAEMKEITLPDGSLVSLNRHSELAYQEDLGNKNRIVTLKGEAFFDVKRDTKKPFVIRVAEVEVEVLGTSFNVSAYSNNKRVEVTVATGQVKMSVPSIRKEISLRKGDWGSFSAQTKELSGGVNQDANFLAWKTRTMVFQNTDLHAVVEKLNEVYDARIEIATDLSPACAVTVTFNQQSLEAVLNVLETTLGLTIQRTRDRIIIVKADC